MIKSDPAFPSQTAQPRISAISPSAMLWLRWAMVSSSSADTLSSLYPLWTANSEMTSARFLPNCYRLRQSAARADTPQGWQRNRLRPSCGRTAARPGHSVSRISGTPFPAPGRTSADSNITAADRNGLRRLVDAVELRLDSSEPDTLEVKAVIPTFPDHPAPKALVCREQEEGRFVPVRQTPAAFPPMCPSSSVSIGQEELRVPFSELLMHPFLELRPHRGYEAVPHELIQIQYTCLDPFIQAGTFT